MARSDAEDDQPELIGEDGVQGGDAPDGAEPTGAARDTSLVKLNSAFSPVGEDGQVYLASGKSVSMRLWRDEPPTGGDGKAPSARGYETVGFVISGVAELTSEGQTVRLEPGDTWMVPAGATHAYRILEPFTAVEATSPPAQAHGRDG
jgi:quercetin dioxygenase-like cupin family protein